MRKHLAVFGLFVRSSLLRILILLGGMILLQAFLFGYTMHTTFSSENLVWGLESIITDSRIVFVFALAFLLMTLQLASVGCSHSSKTGYTLSRLCVTPQTVFLWQVQTPKKAEWLIPSILSKTECANSKTEVLLQEA